MMRSLLALVGLALVACASAAPYGATMLDSGYLFGPSNLTNCIQPPKSLNFTLLNTIPDPTYNASLMPADVSPWIDLRGGTIYTPPGLGSKCFNRSVLYQPKTCVPSEENNFCFEYIPLFNFTWFAVGALACLGGYPDANAISLSNSIPTPGNLGITLSNQCGLSTFLPKGNDTSVLMATIVDNFGNKYALQSSLQQFNTTEEWQAFLASAVLPDGWTHKFVNITEQEYHYPYLVGNNCFILLALDHLGNQYHLYDYAVPLSEGILANTQCSVVYNPAGVDGLVTDPPAPAPASAAARTVAKLSFVVGAAASALLL